MCHPLIQDKENKTALDIAQEAGRPAYWILYQKTMQALVNWKFFSRATKTYILSGNFHKGHLPYLYTENKIFLKAKQNDLKCSSKMDYLEKKSY